MAQCLVNISMVASISYVFLAHHEAKGSQAICLRIMKREARKHKPRLWRFPPQHGSAQVAVPVRTNVVVRKSDVTVSTAKNCSTVHRLRIARESDNIVETKRLQRSLEVKGKYKQANKLRRAHAAGKANSVGATAVRNPNDAVAAVIEYVP